MGKLVGGLVRAAPNEKTGSDKPRPAR